MRTLSRYKLRKISKHLRSGGLIAYPTEAVYGLGCDPVNRDAVNALLALKSRSALKGLILIASDLQQLIPYIQPLSSRITAKLEASWPGPVTWLLPARQTTPKWLTGRHSTLACRVSAHPVVQQLCQAFGAALVSTSANRESCPPCRTLIQVRKQFSKSNQLVIVSGATGDLDKPTPILNALTDLRIR